MIWYPTVVKISKRLFFYDIVHFIDEENIVDYVDFGFVLFSTLKLQRKSDRSTENGITFADPVENPSAFTATINIFVPLISSIALLSFLNPYNLWDEVPAALMSLNHTNDRYSMFNQYPQPTTHLGGFILFRHNFSTTSQSYLSLVLWFSQLTIGN